jgi:hypothetical protein
VAPFSFAPHTRDFPLILRHSQPIPTSRPPHGAYPYILAPLPPFKFYFKYHSPARCSLTTPTRVITRGLLFAHCPTLFLFILSGCALLFFMSFLPIL